MAELKHTWISRDELFNLHEYSHSIPTGVVIGKRWRRRCHDENNPQWIIGEYFELPKDDPGHEKEAGIRWRLAVDDQGDPHIGSERMPPEIIALLDQYSKSTDLDLTFSRHLGGLSTNKGLDTNKGIYNGRITTQTEHDGQILGDYMIDSDCISIASTYGSEVIIHSDPDCFTKFGIAIEALNDKLSKV